MGNQVPGRQAGARPSRLSAQEGGGGRKGWGPPTVLSACPCPVPEWVETGRGFIQTTSPVVPVCLGGWGSSLPSQGEEVQVLSVWVQ